MPINLWVIKIKKRKNHENIWIPTVRENTEIYRLQKLEKVRPFIKIQAHNPGISFKRDSKELCGQVYRI